MVSYKEYKIRKKKLRRITARSIIIILDIEQSGATIYEDGIKIGECKFEIDKKRKNMIIKDFDIFYPYQGKGYGSLFARILIALAKMYHLKSSTLTDGASLNGFWQRLGWNKCTRDGSSKLELK